MSEDNAVVLVRRKNIQTLIDYCLDTRFGFTVNPRGISNDEFEVEVNLGGIKQAIAFGMFARENKLEVSGLGELVKPKTSPKKADSKEALPVLNELAAPAEPVKEEPTLNFDLNMNNN
ncbi:MAG: hypothetical protein LCH37_00610 [Bacteroidetes bacterium]|nr:hypothetical protein [Bacteroidota bacterium]MCK6609516.1 hypothetical protein [Bacteroidia bacterium]